jgi:hypothetical protein
MFKNFQDKEKCVLYKHDTSTATMSIGKKSFFMLKAQKNYVKLSFFLLQNLILMMIFLRSAMVSLLMVENIFFT